MIVKDLKGRECKMPTKPYLIDWEPAREVSRPQAAVKAFLRPYWQRDIVLEELRIPRSLLRCDILNASRGIMVEVSPIASHGKLSKFFHGDSIARWTKALKHDMDKERWAALNGFTFIEITDTDFPLTPELFSSRWGVTL